MANTTIKKLKDIPINIQSTLMIGEGITTLPSEGKTTDETIWLHISIPAQKPIMNPKNTRNKFSVIRLEYSCVLEIPTILKEAKYL
tara:strand:+ start:222 stop:479 length:258 start_codon:yes stop_codon:yes gene_type:complete